MSNGGGLLPRVGGSYMMWMVGALRMTTVQLGIIKVLLKVVLMVFVNCE